MGGKEKFTSYHWKLFFFLGVACFFEGFDFMALGRLLPKIREDLATAGPLLGGGDVRDRDWAGIIGGVVNVGTVLSYFLVRWSDSIGRKKILTITIVGYTITTFATGLSGNVYVFIAFQLLARFFLTAEWAISMVIAAEEFPTHRRGMMIGIINALTSLGAVVCAGAAPLFLATDYGWRSVYFVGVFPLILMAFARRSLRETARFAEISQRTKVSKDLFRIWKTPYAKRLLLMALVWALAYIPGQSGVFYWTEFAITERGFTEAQVSQATVVAALVSMPMVFSVGPVADWIGRRPTALIVFVLGGVGIFFAYTLHDFWWLTAMLSLGIFGASAFLPILNTYTTELFPTSLRGDAFGWANNILGRMSYVIAPLAIGFVAESYGAWGPVVAWTATLNILVAAIILLVFPETKGQALEQTSQIKPKARLERAN